MHKVNMLPYVIIIMASRNKEYEGEGCPHGYEWVKSFKKRNGETVHGFCRKKHERRRNK